ncbi:MAG TPA: IPT/TIG domain-containing protein, partial [Candidatus Acidoferrum sp.]|nr:IPT/TIG domain-containing protein [Candidatus Acidoferrum sp.]
ARFRLQSTPAINTLINNMPPESQIVARAMQQYGLILADVGSSMFVTGASGAVNATNGLILTWDQNDIFAGNGLEVLRASNFDVVSLTPIVTGLSATNGSPGGALTVIGQNFSGAAGRLSVLFGTNAVNAANVLSDTQVSVTIPSGSSIVDVTIQSGINETDTVSGSPGANVNTPIFGYGTSALTPADRFTFLAPTPTIQHVAENSGNFIMTGTNNLGPGGAYHVLASTNLLLPLTNWTVLANGNFDSNGKFSFTNALGTNLWRFYLLRVP